MGVWDWKTPAGCGMMEKKQKAGADMIGSQNTASSQGPSIQQLQEIYEKYDQAFERAAAEAPIGAGLFGMSGGPKDAPCHEIFYGQVADWVAGWNAALPSPQAAEQAVRLILEAAASRRDAGTYWYCYAAQKHAEPLIALLNPASARELLARFEELYPPIDRMPVQQKLCKLLKKQGKNRK